MCTYSHMMCTVTFIYIHMEHYTAWKFDSIAGAICVVFLARAPIQEAECQNLRIQITTVFQAPITVARSARHTFVPNMGISEHCPGNQIKRPRLCLEVLVVYFFLT